MADEPAGRAPMIAMVLVLLSLLVGGFVAGAAVAREGEQDAAGAGVPEEHSADVGFARAMQTHHAQAVQMSWMVRDVTKDPAVGQIALDMLLTQQQQIGQMFAWLQDWGVPPGSVGDPLAWMSEAGRGEHDMSSVGDADSSAMPGMADDSDLDALQRSAGRAAERRYLTLMIPHHQAGVAMAEAAVELATQPEVRRLAQSIVESQSAELTALRDLLVERGGPLPSASATGPGG